MKTFTTIILLFTTLIAFGQSFSKERGIPFIKNYTTSEYNGHEQNFDITQDSSGVMYFANFQAVLIYDGARWKKVPTSSGMRVLGLDVDENGRVYAGGLFDFGYIQKDIYGEYSFKSLVDSTWTEDYIGEIFSVHCIGKTTYFLSKNKLFEYTDNELKIKEFNSDLLGAFDINEEMYLFFERKLNQEDLIQNGLVKYRNGIFNRLIDNSLDQIVDVKVMFYLENSKNYIIGTESQGFFRMHNDTIYNFDVQVNNFAKSNSITCGNKVSEELYVIGSLSNGIVLVTKNGEIEQIIDKKSSLFDESINEVFVDKARNVWLATNNGITLVEINNSLTQISNSASGIEGKINKFEVFKTKMYVATENGLYYILDNSFHKVQFLNFACRDLMVVNNILFIATPLGVYSFDGQSVSETVVTDFAFCFLKDKNNHNRAYIGLNSKIAVVELSNQKINVLDSITGFEGNTTKLGQGSTNELYIEIPPGNIFKATMNNLAVKKLSTGEGFISLHINEFNNEIFFSSEKGAFIDNSNDTLDNFDFFNQFNENSAIWLFDFFKLDSDNYLFTDGSRKNISLITKAEEKFEIKQTDFLPIDDFTVRTFFYDKAKNNIWLGGNDEIIISNFGQNYVHNVKNPVFLSKIISLKKDSLISISTNKTLDLKYTENSIRFEYSAPYYSARGQVLYSYFLEGFDKNYSLWTEQPYKEYTNLPSGTYIFYVNAKDQFGNDIQGVSYEFKILVPIYKRWWMIVIYVLVFAVLIKLFVDWRVKQSEKEKQKLEDIIRERTAEIEKSKAEIEAQRDIEYKQRKEIMSSIHYAKRIQQAVLPSPEMLKDVLGENYFVVFRPYEVVSGDYFWIKQLKNFIVVVAADCTGHGVPGAFMSMLGTSFLNEIITRRSLDSTGVVLDRLRQKVKSSLHQEGKQNEQKDGMDIAVYFIDKEAYELQYSGAYNSLYIIRENNKITDEIKQLCEENPKKYRLYEDEDSSVSHTLIELRANRQPIGIYIKEVPFDNVVIKLEKGDCLYSFSDGYQDQFGGDTGEKYNAKRFKKLLLNVQNKPMDEQKRILEQNFIKWKGDLNQVDDVLVFGLRIDF